MTRLSRDIFPWTSPKDSLTVLIQYSINYGIFSLNLVLRFLLSHPSCHSLLRQAIPYLTSLTTVSIHDERTLWGLRVELYFSSSPLSKRNEESLFLVHSLASSKYFSSANYPQLWHVPFPGETMQAWWHTSLIQVQTFKTYKQKHLHFQVTLHYEYCFKQTHARETVAVRIKLLLRRV